MAILHRRAVASLLFLIGLTGCSAHNLINRVTLAPSPHESYADGLRGAKLGETALGRDWARASERAIRQPLSITLPLNESGYFPADTPTAVGYRLELQRGRQLSVDLTFDGLELPRLFVDLFEVRDGKPERVASLTEGTTLTFTAPRDGGYVLRIQPELLRSGRFSVLQRTLASLPFPVSGLTAAAVQSEFGATRNAGRRQHEGIDIFAPRHTPALAVVDGVARTGTNTLGGNVVWLRGQAFGESFYYAHLERFAFEGTANVKAGDVLGYVGNTGNARTTAPHLHFGIYDRGAIDPFPFIGADDPTPAAGAAAGPFNEWVRVTATRAALRNGPARTAPVTAQLNRGALARVGGAIGAQLRVELPDRVTGYVEGSAVALARTPLRQQRLAVGTVLRDQPMPNAPAIVTFDRVTTADVLGDFKGFSYVRTSASGYGWVAS